MGRIRGQVRVRGTCKAGHTTEATSDPGRVTWEGPCAGDGCTCKVKARRIPSETKAATSPATKAKAGAAGGDDPYHVIEVTHDPDDPKPKRKTPTPKQDPGAGGEPGGGGADPGKAPVVQPEPEPDPQLRGARGRWAGRSHRPNAEQRAAARAKVDQEWVIPGVIAR